LSSFLPDIISTPFSIPPSTTLENEAVNSAPVCCLISKLELTGGISLAYSIRSGISAVYLLRLSDEPLEFLALTGGPGTNPYIVDSLPDNHSFGECDSKFAKSSKYVVDPGSVPEVKIWSTFRV